MMEQKEGERKDQLSIKSAKKGQGKERKVNDVIYGFIYHDQVIWDIIDTPQFQRLRKIKKLQCLEYVFPSGNHSRYEHSVGSAYLAKLFINTLIKNNPTAYKDYEQQQAVKTITVAALIYGLGYAPFHHAFQNQIGLFAKNKWTLESTSIAIFEKILQGNPQLKQNLSNEQQRIKDLIRGDSLGKARPWQFDLINNKKYEIDIDKLQGFRRDAFYLGNKHLYIQNQLLMNEARIVEDKLAYPIKYIQTVYNIFETRYKFNKFYYFNISSIGIEQMICDILEHIKHRFQLEQACEIDKLESFLRLNDSILSKIRYTEFIEKQIKQSKQTQQRKKWVEKLKGSKLACQILSNLNVRKIYKLVKQLMYYIHQQNVSQAQKITIQKMKQELSKNTILQKIHEHSKNILQGKICLTLSDGFGDTLTNPLKKVSFFRFNNNNQMKLEKEKDIQKLGKRYEAVPIERSIKLYIKQDEPTNFNLALTAIESFSQQFNKKCQNINK